MGENSYFERVERVFKPLVRSQHGFTLVATLISLGLMAFLVPVFMSMVASQGDWSKATRSRITSNHVKYLVLQTINNVDNFECQVQSKEIDTTAASSNEGAEVDLGVFRSGCDLASADNIIAAKDTKVHGSLDVEVASVKLSGLKPTGTPNEFGGALVVNFKRGNLIFALQPVVIDVVCTAEASATNKRPIVTCGSAFDELAYRANQVIALARNVNNHPIFAYSNPGAPQPLQPPQCTTSQVQIANSGCQSTGGGNCEETINYLVTAADCSTSNTTTTQSCTCPVQPPISPPAQCTPGRVQVGVSSGCQSTGGGNCEETINYLVTAVDCSTSNTTATQSCTCLPPQCTPSRTQITNSGCQSTGGGNCEETITYEVTAADCSTSNTTDTQSCTCPSSTCPVNKVQIANSGCQSTGGGNCEETITYEVTAADCSTSNTTDTQSCTCPPKRCTPDKLQIGVGSGCQPTGGGTCQEMVNYRVTTVDCSTFKITEPRSCTCPPQQCRPSRVKIAYSGCNSVGYGVCIETTTYQLTAADCSTSYEFPSQMCNCSSTSSTCTTLGAKPLNTCSSYTNECVQGSKKIERTGNLFIGSSQCEAKIWPCLNAPIACCDSSGNLSAADPRLAYTVPKTYPVSRINGRCPKLVEYR